MRHFVSNETLVASLLPVDDIIQQRWLQATSSVARGRLAGGRLDNLVPLTAAGIHSKREGAHFIIPIVIPEGVPTGDGRTFRPASLTMRNLPLPLMWQIFTDNAHDKSVIVGRIDSIERTPQGIGNARGVFDTGPYGVEAERLVRGGMLRWVSADLDKFSAKVKQTEQTFDDETDEPKMDEIKDEETLITSGRLMAITLVAKPAFQEAIILLDEQVNDQPVILEDRLETPMAPSDVSLTASAARDRRLLSLVAAGGIPVAPPREWFTNPKLTGKTPLTIDDTGRVYGHIAAWDVDHIGYSFSQKPPRSSSRYAYFHTGVVRTADGADIPVGQLTLAGGHASLDASAAEAVKHYDDTSSAFADVHAGEDEFGIWVAGALRPSVTPEQIRAARASAPSGDWRPVRGKLELVAVCQVNVPGFPVPRARVASGMVTAMVAAGTPPLLHELAQRRELEAHAEAARATLNALRDQRNAALAVRASAAVERLSAFRASRVAAVSPGYDDDPDHRRYKYRPGNQPRSSDGRFRQVLARLKLNLGDVDEMQQAVEKIEEAENLSNAGNYTEAARAAGDVISIVDRVDEKIINPESIEGIREGARALGEAIANLPLAFGADAEKYKFSDLPPATRDLIDDMIDRVIVKIGEEDAMEAVAALKAFRSGADYFNQSDISAELSKLLRLLT